MNKKQNLTNAVQKYRVYNSLKQHELATKTGISVSEIRKIEKNKVTPIKSNRIKLAEFFNVSIGQLFWKEEDGKN